MIEVAVASAMERIKRTTVQKPGKLRWTPSKTPTGPYSARYLESVLYSPEDDNPGILIGAAIAQYHAENTHRRLSSVYHVTEAINHLLLTVGLHENLPLYEVTRERLNAYKSIMLQGKGPRAARQRVAQPPTIAKKLGLLKAWLKWCVGQGFIDKNPMEGLELPARMVTKSKIKRSGFTDEQLATIFKLLAPYRDASIHEPMRVEWYWLVMCLAFTGARLSEIGQLLRSDVKAIDAVAGDGSGVWCFSLIEGEDENGEKKELKNAPSQRIVPLHSQLIHAGFLAWLHAQPIADRLFPCLWKRGLVKASLWFAYLLIHNGLKTKALVLHSYRHTWAVRLELARTHHSLQRRILGHALGSDTESRIYLQSLTYSAKELQEALEKVRFPID